MNVLGDERKPSTQDFRVPGWSFQHFNEIVNSLLDSIGGDEQLRNTTEAALIRIARKRHDEIIEVFCEYRKKHQKLGETQSSIILRVIEYVVVNLIDKISHETASKCVEYSVNEITRCPDQQITIQDPCREILVSVGRRYCKEVMDALTKHVEQHQVAHFMIIYTMGATASMESISLIKPILGFILPTLASIKQDHPRQAYAFAIGRFGEAFCEYKEHLRLNPNEETPMKTGFTYDISDEAGICYDLLQNHWLSSREPKLCYEVLNALSCLYPLLPVEKINDGLLKVIPSTLALYRRSIDRSVVTQYLASIIKTVLALNASLLSGVSDTIIATLFDLVCVNPDYHKPQTVKGHYEALRCFDLMANDFGDKIVEVLLIHLRSNNERERIKSLLVLTHLTNTSETIIVEKQLEICTILKSMLVTERSIKLKMVLLKTVVAFMQRNFVHEREFVIFLIRGSCRLAKFNTEHGSNEEYLEFVKACNNTLFILSSTIGTMDDILRIELLQNYLRLEFTDISSTIGKCLANLLAKSPEIGVSSNPDRRNPFDENEPSVEEVRPPNPLSVFVRSLALLGNFDEMARIQNVLAFLKSYSPYLYKHLVPLWNEKLGEIVQELGTIDQKRYDALLFEFIQATIKDIDENKNKFVESVIAEIYQQLPLYQPLAPGTNQPSQEFRIPFPLDREKRMLIKVLGMFLSHSPDEHLVANKVDLIIGLAKAEKLEKSASNESYEILLQDHAKALGYVSVVHLDIIMKKLLVLVIENSSVKKSGSFFSNLNFIKDSNKETDNFKTKVLVLQSLNYVVTQAQQEKVVQLFDETVINYLTAQFDNKELFLKKLILQTFMNLAAILLNNPNALPEDHMNNFKNKNELLKICMNITCDSQNEYLPMFPLILILSTSLIKLNRLSDENVDVNGLLNTACFYFFTTAQNLKTKFNSIEEDNRNSYLAKYLNLSLPELNNFIQAILEQNGSPACLDDINSILEIWLKDRNNEVRICAGHVYNKTLEVYMKSMKIGCEAPSKFNQTGSLLGKTIPRCIDSNATVRQTAIEVLKKILEIACIYETLTIADSRVEWVKELDAIREEIVTDDPKDIYRIASHLANIIAKRLSNYQYVYFSKCLLYSLNDPEESSSIGASVVLKFFMQVKGAEMFHAIPELIKECLHAVKVCDIPKARSGVLKSMLAITKHHPKLVCNEMLGQSLPLEDYVVDYWRTVACDAELTGIILHNFIGTLTTSCLFEQQHQDKPNDSQKVVTLQPFAIVCVLNELFKSQEIKQELKLRFTEIFCMMLSTLATYINLQPPCVHVVSQEGGNVAVPKNSKRAKSAARDSKLNPCQIALDTYKTFLDTLDMQQISNVLTVCPDLGSSTDLNSFIEILTPLSVATASEVGINSTTMKQIVLTLSKYVSSPYDSQRIASTGFYSHLVPLKPCGEISSVIMLHLNSSLNDPNPLVRGLGIRGMSYLACLTDHDVDKYSEMCLTALMKGIDDYNKECFINIPLESMRGLSKILQNLAQDKFEVFQVSLSIRIKPFFENMSTELRECAILLLGDLCHQKANDVQRKTLSKQEGSIESDDGLASESLLEQLKANLCSLLLHLSEENLLIARACKITLKNVCALLATPKMNQLAQNHLLEHGQLQYGTFIKDFVKLIGEELQDSINDFIDACLPFMRSQWAEIRGNAAVLIGLLHMQSRTGSQADAVGHKISQLLKDEESGVRVKAAESLGFIYGEC